MNVEVANGHLLVNVMGQVLKGKLYAIVLISAVTVQDIPGSLSPGARAPGPNPPHRVSGPKALIPQLVMTKQWWEHRAGCTEPEPGAEIQEGKSRGQGRGRGRNRSRFRNTGVKTQRCRNTGTQGVQSSRSSKAVNTAKGLCC